MTVYTCGSAIDTIVSVYTGSCGALTQVACNDDNGSVGLCPGGLTSYISLTPAANTTYYIRVSGYNGATGSFNVRAAGGTTAVTIPTSPSSPTVTRSGTSSSVRWTDRSSNETLFRIERQQRVGSNWTNTVTFTVGANVTSFTNAVGAGRWRWRIRAENSAGASAYTAYVQQTVN